MKFAGDAIGQADADGAHPLPQHLGLRLDDDAVIGPDEVVPRDQNRLPLARTAGVESMLMDVGRHDGLGLHVDQILPTVRLDAQGQVGVRVDVPQAPTEDGGGTGPGAPGGVATAHDLWPIAWELGGDGAVEIGVGRLRRRCRHEVELGLGEAAGIGVGELLAIPDRGPVVEGDEGEGRRRRRQALLPDRWHIPPSRQPAITGCPSSSEPDRPPMRDRRLNSSRLRPTKPR